MRPRNSIIPTARMKAEQERTGRLLTKAALATCDAAGIVTQPPNELVETHRRLHDVMAERSSEFDEWQNRTSKSRWSFWKTCFDRWCARLGRPLSLSERCKLPNSPDFREFVAEEHRQNPPADRFFLDEPFQVLKHVSLPPDHRLESRFEDMPGGGHAEMVASTPGSDLPLRDALVLDGTPESFGEAHVLLFEASQFYLFWHSNYGARFPVYDLRDFLETFHFCSDTGGIVFDRLTENERQVLLRTDFAPRLTRIGDAFEIRCVVFSPFGGFYERKLVLANKNPGVDIKETREALVDYNCGIKF